MLWLLSCVSSYLVRFCKGVVNLFSFFSVFNGTILSTVCLLVYIQQQIPAITKQLDTSFIDKHFTKFNSWRRTNIRTYDGFQLFWFRSQTYKLSLLFYFDYGNNNIHSKDRAMKIKRYIHYISLVIIRVFAKTKCASYLIL